MHGIREELRIIKNEPIANEVWRIVLSAPTSRIVRPGQFVNILVPGFFLRRPISVCDYDEDSLTLIYKTFGEGTKALSRLPIGAHLDALMGLGNGFDISVRPQRPLLVGGGVGVPPLYKLCKVLLQQGAKPSVVMGFQTQDDVFYKEEFEALCPGDVHVATMNGGMGHRGLVTDIIDGFDFKADYLFACGPVPMLKALCRYQIPAQLSFEERMGCGFGACMGCTHETKNGNKRICLEGPVLQKEEIVW